MADPMKGQENYIHRDKQQQELFKDAVAGNMFACFHEGQYERCDEVAEYYEDNKNLEAARNLFKKTCDDHDYARSCFSYARMRYLETRQTRDVEEPYEYYKKSCHLADKRGCYMAGLLRQLDKDKPGRSALDAIEHFQRGCRLFEKHSCFQLHQMYRKGWGSEVPRDAEKALDFAAQACEAGGRAGCQNAFLMLKHGHGVPKDEERAELYKERGILIDINSGFNPWKNRKKFKFQVSQGDTY